ncbi:MAG: hypothetical protein QOC84_467 [Bradyrhizobium sp.]|jgi:hypothetical protein|nr:hypothetical protein [Bradyrhizobium sp.]
MTEQQNSPAPPADPISAAEVRIAIQSLKDDIAAELKRLSEQNAGAPARSGFDWSWIPQFFSSGVFFILLGIALLIIARNGLGIVHTSFSFVLVVLGTAIMLFGTGTQGMGKLESDAATAKYNVAIAGGAGVLAIVIAFGMIKYAPQIHSTFDIETKYLVVRVQPKADGSTDLSQYWGRFEIDGMAIPSARRGKGYEVFVPYSNGQDGSKHVSYSLLADPVAPKAGLKSLIEETVNVEVSDQNIDRANAGFSFPVSRNLIYISAKSSDAKALSAAAAQQLPVAEGKTPPTPGVAPILEAQ